MDKWFKGKAQLERERANKRLISCINKLLLRYKGNLIEADGVLNQTIMELSNSRGEVIQTMSTGPRRITITIKINGGADDKKKGTVAKA